VMRDGRRGRNAQGRFAAIGKIADHTPYARQLLIKGLQPAADAMLPGWGPASAGAKEQGKPTVCSACRNILLMAGCVTLSNLAAPMALPVCMMALKISI
jgi:hypothetical protein